MEKYNTIKYFPLDNGITIHNIVNLKVAFVKPFLGKYLFTKIGSSLSNELTGFIPNLLLC